MWDHFGSQVFRSKETLNAENEILKEIVSRQRKKLLLLARQISQIESRSNPKKPTSDPVNEPIVTENDVNEPYVIDNDCSGIKNNHVTDIAETAVIDSPKVTVTDIPETTVIDGEKSATKVDPSVQKRRTRKRTSDGSMKEEQPPKKRRSSKRNSEQDTKLLENSKESSGKIAEKPKLIKPTPAINENPPKIRRSSRTARQKSPENEIKISPPKRNIKSTAQNEKSTEKPPTKFICKWQKITKNSNPSESANQECKKSFGSINALHKHLQSHVPSWVAENASYVCYWNGCKRNQKAYSGRVKLISHFSQHTV